MFSIREVPERQSIFIRAISTIFNFPSVYLSFKTFSVCPGIPHFTVYDPPIQIFWSNKDTVRDRFSTTAQMRLHTLEWSWIVKMLQIQLWWFSLHCLLTRLSRSSSRSSSTWLPLQPTGFFFWILISQSSFFMVQPSFSGEKLAIIICQIIR